ncbi:MAG: SRPBCC family protein [Chitinophagales bacterium]|nr:SRPBCC family protein [Chitinophagales bacterium]
MSTIILREEIEAPIEVCFNLSRSIDFHIISTEHTGEKAVAGRTSGLICLNETVTWQAKHLGIWQHYTSRITAMCEPDFFADEMVKGAFKSVWHEHRFQQTNKGTLMIDTFRFESPFGIIGKIFNRLFLTGYMKCLLHTRNHLIKEYAESGKWKTLPGFSTK